MDSLLIGRLFSLAVKGILIFVVLIFVSNHLTPTLAWKAAYCLALQKEQLAATIYRIIWNVHPHLVPTAYRTLLVFFIATMTPFFSIWLVSFYRKSRQKKIDLFWH